MKLDDLMKKMESEIFKNFKARIEKDLPQIKGEMGTFQLMKMVANEEAKKEKVYRVAEARNIINEQMLKIYEILCEEEIIKEDIINEPTDGNA